MARKTPSQVTKEMEKANHWQESRDSRLAPP